jgi:hypothetical protein
VLVQWPDGKVNVLQKVAVNQTLTLDQKNGDVSKTDNNTNSNTLFTTLDNVIDYQHHENTFVDFDRDHLIYHMLSTEGPRLSKGDVNGDGLDDVYVGGAKDSPGALFVQSSMGKFGRTNEKLFEADKAAEDLGSVFLMRMAIRIWIFMSAVVVMSIQILRQH